MISIILRRSSERNSSFLRQDISKANQFQILHFQILKMTKNNSATAISTGGGIIPVMLPITIVTMKDEKEKNNNNNNNSNKNKTDSRLWDATCWVEARSH